MMVRSRIGLGGVAVLSLLLAGVRPAAAEDGKNYVGVSGMVSTQGSQTPCRSSSCPNTGVGGTALGISGEFGRFQTDTLSLAFELSVPARFESKQEIADIRTLIDNRHRDLIFSALFHSHVPPMKAIRLALVAGPSVIREDTLQTVAFGSQGPAMPSPAVTRWTVGLTFRADVGVQVSRHLQIVPQIRFHWVVRGSAADNSSTLGSWIIRPAIGGRVSF